MNGTWKDEVWKQIRRFQKFRRKKINKKNRGRLKNTQFSLLCNNCNGALLLHDLGLQFRTPTVNLWLEPGQYVAFLAHLSHYLSCNLEFSDSLEQQYGYPVGVLDGKINLYFTHYLTRQEARAKWQERAKRVDMDNLFIWFCDRDGCTYEDIRAFDALPYENKVIFTHKPYPEFKSAFYIKGFEEEDSVGLMFTFESIESEKKYYDQFPYIDWFNGDLS